jgi:beta-lactamase regulating signal transducer with metallopeptidase domain
MSAVLWWLGQNSLTVAILIPLVHGVCRIYRRRPAVQHVLWVVVLVKFITPPLVSWPWTVQQMQGLAGPTRSFAPASARTRTKRVEGLPTSGKEASLETVADAPARGVVARERPEIANIVLWLAMVGWLVGAAVCLILQIRRIARHASLVRQGTTASEQLREVVRKSAQRLNLRPPRVVVVRGLLSPFMWFVGHLRLVWPEAMSGRAAIARARSIIAHELAHVRRGDHWVAWLELAAGIVWWWNPLFWLVRRQLRETGEMACDALAIGTYPESRREYAELLLELSAGIQTGAPAPVLAVSAGTPSSFERRLSMILSDRVSGKLSSWGILAAVCLSLVALPGWSWEQEPKKLEREPSEKARSEKLPAACREGIAKYGSAEANVCMKCHASLTGIPGGLGYEQKKPDRKASEKARSEELPAACREGIAKYGSAEANVCMKCHAAPAVDAGTANRSGRRKSSGRSCSNRLNISKRWWRPETRNSRSGRSRSMICANGTRRTASIWMNSIA